MHLHIFYINYPFLKSNFSYQFPLQHHKCPFQFILYVSSKFLIFHLILMLNFFIEFINHLISYF